MVLLVKKLYLGYNKLQEWGDPRVENLPLMGSLLTPAFILAAYACFVFKLGPQLMQNRKPFKLTGLLMFYNLLQIGINIVGLLCALFWWPKSNISCMPVSRESDFPGLFQLYTHYLYVILKVLDLLDTIFFVLRKKYNQITFLHLYHHISMVIGSWGTCKYYPGGQLYYLGGVNCFIHIFMYFYYFLTVWDSRYKGSIWWKKYLTQMQIVQHCIIFCSVLIPLLNSECSYSKTLLAGYLPVVTVLIYLFVDFYIKAYVKPKKPEVKQT